MNQTRFKNIIPLVIIIVLTGTVGYFALIKKQSEPTIQTSEEEIQIVTINNLVNDPKKFLNKKVQVTGKFIFTGKNYFTDPEFAITDGTNNFSVNAWIPLEVPPPMPGSSDKQRPILMKDFLNKIVTLQGVVEKYEQSFYLVVTKAE